MMDQEFRDEIVDRLARIETKLDGVCNDKVQTEKTVRTLDKRLDDQALEIREIKVKSGIFGALTGLLAGLAAAVWR